MSALTLVASIALAPALAVAQAPTVSPSASAAPVAAPPIDGDSPPAPATPIVRATGYSFDAPRAPTTQQRVERAHVQAGRANRAATDATVAGFETLVDGSTLLFVELSRPALYETKPGRSSVTYVLKGVRVDRRNDQNPLVTVHFNTPMTSAHLAPHGTDLWLVVDLRANVQPATTMEATKNGAAMLRVEFPKGEYLPIPSEAASAVAPNVPAAPGGTGATSSKVESKAAP